MKSMQKPFYLLMVLALLAGLLGFQPAKPVQAANALRISQVYTGGGVAGSTYTHDFFEIFNSGSSSVSLSGMSIQYASATGTNDFGYIDARLTVLPDVMLDAGKYYLIQGGTDAPIGTPSTLTPDFIDSTPINAAEQAGKIALVNSQFSLECYSESTCSPDELGLIIDLVGYGNTTFHEGTADAPYLSSTTSAQRADGGCTDTDDNAADFEALTPIPRNSDSPTNSCGSTIFPERFIISEYMEGSSNNKAIELYNGTGADIDLQNYKLVLFSNGSTTPGNTLEWDTETILASGETYVIANASAIPEIRALADITSNVTFYNGDDALVLFDITTEVDVVQDSFGQRGNAADWEAAEVTLVRKETVCQGDVLPDDAFEPSVEYNDFPQDTYSDLGSHTMTCGPAEEIAPTVVSTVPADEAVNVAVDANIVITFSEPVTVTDPDPWFTISCTESGTHTAVVTDADTVFTLNPDTDFVTGETCTVTVLAAKVTDDDTEDPPDTMEANYVFSFDTISVCGDGFTPIYEIQGSSLTSTLVGKTVTTEGVVVGDYQTGAYVSGTKNGFYIQDINGDEDPGTSDGIFIYSYMSDVLVGDHVRVTGNVAEYIPTGEYTESLTQISSVSQILTCDTGITVEPTVLALPVEDALEFESHEGMLVTIPQELTISEYYNFGRYGEIKATNSRFLQFTAVNEPDVTGYSQWVNNYFLNSITLDDGRTGQNPDPAYHPNGDEFTLENLFRGGDLVSDITGIFDHSYDLYRIQPRLDLGYFNATYTPVNTRPVDPEIIEGDLKVASFNVLNYFVTLDLGPDICGPLGNMECRGADSAEELTRQRDKILAALIEIDADVYGLMEIENDRLTGEGDAVADLVAGINAIAGTDTYAYIDTGAIGTDAIKQAIIYKPNSVTPVGDYHILDSSVDSRFIDTKNRPVIAQVFEDNETGEQFVVAVNHLKSKGSDCDDLGDPDLGDGAGNCNLTRLEAAEAMVDWLADTTYFPDVEKKLIIGDLNSYDKEDPINAIKLGSDDTADTEDDYLDLIFELRGDNAYGYVFDGQTGYLDYAMANLAMAESIVDVNFWHINADEPSLIDYDMSYKLPEQDALYAPDAYRSSDHDPVIVTLEFNASPIAQDQEVTTAKNTSIEITLVATDADGDELTYAIVDQPTNGTVVLVGNIATYTPANDYIGPDSFNFKANDGELDSTVATVSITVTDTDYYLYLPIILK